MKHTHTMEVDARNKCDGGKTNCANCTGNAHVKRRVGIKAVVCRAEAKGALLLVQNGAVARFIRWFTALAGVSKRKVDTRAWVGSTVK